MTISPEPEERQRTLGRPVVRDGHGLHTGLPVTATLRPADPDTGFVFRRIDLDDRPAVRATVDNVTGVEWETVIGEGDESVRTIEHLLAAVVAAKIDNLEVELHGPEPPSLDGSAAGWCEAIREAGTAEQDAVPRVLTVKDPLQVTSGRSRYTVIPHPRYRVSAEIEFENPVIGRQFASLEVEGERFCREVAGARTFGLAIWKEKLHSRGLALGASHENTVVVTQEGLAPETRLRFPDEFVRHKIIDLIGDLALLGVRLRAHVVANRPGHRGNVALVRRLRDTVERGHGSGRLGIEEILEHIPHRYPFLLVDRILEFEAGKRVVGLKNVTINEPFFTGHFPDHPIMPGVLIVEAMAQVGGLLLMNEFEDPRNKVVYFMSLDNVKFRKPVVPGDQLVFELEMVHFRGRVCKMRGVGRVDGQPVAEATMLARVVDK